MRIRAFQGLVPNPVHTSEVACVPYDVVNATEAAALAVGKPRSLLHVDRAEIDLPADTNPYSERVYAKAHENLVALQHNGSLGRETGPCLYVYEQRMGTHRQRGLVAVCHVEDYDAELIKKHEKTRKDKEDDRTTLIDTLSANTGPVFLTYRDEAGVTALVNAKVKETPLHDFTAPDGIQHTVWRVAGGAEWVQAFGRVPVTYIADGHHRAASAARVARGRRERNPQHTGSEDYNWFLCVLFPASELKILPYNRIVVDLNGLQPVELLAKVQTIFGGLTENAAPTPTAIGHVSMYLAKMVRAALSARSPGGSGRTARRERPPRQITRAGPRDRRCTDEQADRFCGRYPRHGRISETHRCRGRRRVFDVPRDPGPTDGYFGCRPDHATEEHVV